MKQSRLKSNILQMVGNPFVSADQIPWMLLILNPQYLAPTVESNFRQQFIPPQYVLCHSDGIYLYIPHPLCCPFFGSKNCEAWRSVFFYNFLGDPPSLSLYSYHSNPKNVRVEFSSSIAWRGVGFRDRRLFQSRFEGGKPRSTFPLAQLYRREEGNTSIRTFLLQIFFVHVENTFIESCLCTSRRTSLLALL